MNYTNIYIYNQTRTVVLINPGTPSSAYSLREETVYAKNLILHKGVDNVLQFWFKNVDQKKYDITGLTFTLRILSQDTEELLFETRLTQVNMSKGYAEAVITEEQSIDIATQYAYYSIERDDGTTSLPAFVDEQGGGRGVIQIVDSVYPKHKASDKLSLLQNLGGMQYSEEYVTSSQPLHTFQITVDQLFNGTVLFQGAVDQTGSWYDIGMPVSIVGPGTGIYNIEGYHPYLRIKFIITAGNVDKILVR